MPTKYSQQWDAYLSLLINSPDSDEKYWTNFLNFRHFQILMPTLANYYRSKFYNS